MLLIVLHNDINSKNIISTEQYCINLVTDDLVEELLAEFDLTVPE